MRARSRLSSLFLAVLALLAAGCESAVERPNVLILVSDAFRADALSCAGGEARTPNLCSLAERGVLFENAFSNAPWTLPSSIALMSGRSPGWFKRAAEISELEEGARFYRVPDGDVLLAEALAGHGYESRLDVENPVAKRGNAFQGFRPGAIEGEALNELVEALRAEGAPMRDRRYRRPLWLVDLFRRIGNGEAPDATPFLALHWIDDPHAPYEPPPGLLPEAVPDGLPHPVAWYAGLGHRHRPEKDQRKLRRVASELSDDEIAFLRHLYHLEIESVDERIGLVLDALDRAGLADSTIVVFTSDHGEAFGEHGDFLHGVSLYGELVRVPLIFAGPGVEGGRRVEAPVSHLDVMPTLLGLLGLDGLAETPGPFAGESLAPVLRGSGTVPRRAIYVASPDRTARDSVIHGRYRLLAERRGDGEGERTELYDHVADPGERRDLSAELPEVRDDLLRALARFRDEEHRIWLARQEAGEAGLSEEERTATERALRAVGYID